MDCYFFYLERISTRLLKASKGACELSVATDLSTISCTDLCYEYLRAPVLGRCVSKQMRSSSYRDHRASWKLSYKLANCDMTMRLAVAKRLIPFADIC